MNVFCPLIYFVMFFPNLKRLATIIRENKIEVPLPILIKYGPLPVFEDAHMSNVCVHAFIEVSVRALYCVIY